MLVRVACDLVYAADSKSPANRLSTAYKTSRSTFIRLVSSTRSAGSFWSGRDFQGFPADAPQHATENHVMQRCYGVPIEKARQAARVEQGTLLQHALELTARLNAKFDQCFAGQLHFGAEHEPPVAFQSNDSPEV